MKISEIEKLSLNPFWISKILCHFVEGYGSPTPFELSYLAVPLIIRNDSRKALCKLNKRSTIYSAFLETPEKRLRIGSLQNHARSYKEYINPSLLVYSKCGNNLSRFLTNGKQFDFRIEKDLPTKEYLKSAYVLGSIFSKERVSECFYKLGVFDI